MAVQYTVAFVPTHQWLVILDFRCHEYGELRTEIWLSVRRKTHFSWSFLHFFQPCHLPFQNYAEALTSKAEKDLVRHLARSHCSLFHCTRIQTARYFYQNFIFIFLLRKICKAYNLEKAIQL